LIISREKNEAVFTILVQLESKLFANFNVHSLISMHQSEFDEPGFQ